MRSRADRRSAQPLWSACSCVMKMASIWSASMPAAASRLSSSRMPRPQSTSRCVGAPSARAWMMVALPVLPLPRDLNRIKAGPSRRTGPARAGPVFNLLQVVGDHLHDPLRVRGGLGRAVGIEHRHGGGLAFGLQVDAVLQRLLGGTAAAEDLAEEARLLLVGVRRHVAHEVGPLAAVAIFHGEAGAIQREADAAPGAVEALVDDDH